MKKCLVMLLAACLIFSAVGCGGGTAWDENFVPEKPAPLYTASEEKAPSNEDQTLKLAVDPLSEEEVFYTLLGTDEGILPDDRQGDAQAINAALLKLSREHGGGTLYLPSGMYLLDEPILMQKNTALVGDWTAPDEEGVPADGTLLVIRFGAGTDSVAPADAAIRTAGGSAVRHLTIGYANQDAQNPVVYPYTIGNGEYLGARVEGVTLLNSYRGIRFANHNIVTLKDLYVTALCTGISIDGIYDIGVQENINVSYRYWAKAGGMLPDVPSEQIVREATRKATAFEYARYDWIYADHISAEGYGKGVHMTTTGNGTLNGQMTHYRLTDCQTALAVEAMNNIGVQISDSVFQATGENAAAIRTSSNMTFETVYQFDGCDFQSEGNAVFGGGTGVLSFADCTFTSSDPALAAVYAEAGSYLFDRCSFDSAGKDIEVPGSFEGDQFPRVSTMKLINCTFEGEKQIQSALTELGSPRHIEKNEDYGDLEVPNRVDENLTGKEVTGPEKTEIFNVLDYGAVADGNLSDNTGTDNTEAFQHALNVAGQNGGGIVFVPSGSYYLKDYLVIPEGVWLRGNAVTNKHFGVGAKGTTLITDCGKGKGGSDKAFLNLSANSGVSLLNVFYPDQHYKNQVAYTPAICIFGDQATVDRVTIPNAYIGVFNHGFRNFHSSFSRICGLNVSYLLVEADGLRIDYGLTTGGDWQDGEGRVDNAPPQDLWKSHPNYENTAIFIKDSDEVVLYESFTFGMGKGLHLVGEINGLRAIGFGVDASRDGIVFDHAGTDNVFLGTELVGVDSFFRTTKNFTGTVSLYNTMAWMSHAVNTVFDGNGTVNVRQYKVMQGEVLANSGTLNLTDSIFNGAGTHLSLTEGVRGGALNCMGAGVGFNFEGESSGFILENCTYV